MISRLQTGHLGEPAATSSSQVSAIDPASTKLAPYERTARKAEVGGGFALTSDYKPPVAGSLLDRLPSFLMGDQAKAPGGLLVDIREPVVEAPSSGGGQFDKAIEDYRNAQKESTSYALVSALVQTAMSSFKRLTQGQ
ncbi:hypothetical protein ACFSE1_18965 [Rhizobium helianthi]|uniref:Uncharacterized protein n=1 Tax=Rhizobium helianthi TaxID=1132695 RepID=A0ABW4M9S2_9HYPH